MFFILQKEKNILDFEIVFVEDKLRQNKYTHEYTFYSKDDFYDKETKELLNIKNYPNYIANGIPIGTIDFVGAWLSIFKNVKNMNPIEIPPILRKDEFLKRDYAIVTSDKLPKSGKYFIKDVSKLKSFSSLSYDDIRYLPLDEMLKSPMEIKDLRENKLNTALYLDNTHLYQVSEKVNILSEYRVYIIDGEIQAISNYNGNPCILPDISLIQKANLLYSTQPNYPKSYTMDIMVNERGTSIIEIHPFTSIGLYNSLWGNNLLYAYRDGIDYYVNHNTKIETFSNFKI